MTTNAFSTAYAGKLTFDANGAPNGVAEVTQSFFKSFTNSLTNPFVGGTNIATGLGNTVGEAVKAIGTHTVLNLLEEKTGLRADLRRIGQ